MLDRGGNEVDFGRAIRKAWMHDEIFVCDGQQFHTTWVHHPDMMNGVLQQQWVEATGPEGIG